MSVIEVSLLGEELLRVNGEAIHLTLTSSKMLLLCLVESRTGRINRTLTAETLWPDMEKSSAQQNFRQALHHMRKQLEPTGYEGLHANRNTVEIDLSSVVLDTRTLIANISKAELPINLISRVFQNSFITELSEQHSLNHDWLDSIRENYRQEVLNALTELVHSELPNKQRISAAELLIKNDSGDEKTCRNLMQLLVDNDEPNAALRHYERLWNQLDSEFEIEPSSATQELAIQIKLQITNCEKISSNERAYQEVTSTEDYLPNVSQPNTSPRSAIETRPGYNNEINNVFALNNDNSCRLYLFDGTLVSAAANTPENTFVHNGIMAAAERLETDTGIKTQSFADKEFVFEFSHPRQAAQFAIDVLQQIRVHTPLYKSANLHTANITLLSCRDPAWKSSQLAFEMSKFSHGEDIIISTGARDQLTDQLDGQLTDLGDQSVAWLKSPLRLFQLRKTQTVPISPERQQQIHRTAIRLAIVPFRVLNPGQKNEFLLGEAIADELINRFSQFKDIQVMSRLSTRFFSADSPITRNAGSLLQCDYLLSGTCRIDGNSLNIQIELADGQEMTIVSNLHDRLSHYENPDARNEYYIRLSNQLNETLNFNSTNLVRTTKLGSLRSHILFTGAVNLMNRYQKNDFLLAKRALDELLERDSNCVSALAALADWRVLVAHQGLAVNAHRNTSLAIDNIAKAIEIDPANSFVLRVYGDVALHFNKSVSEAEASYQKAVELANSNGDALINSAALCAFTDRGVQAIEESNRAISLSPVDPSSYRYKAISASAFLANNDNAQALKCAEQAIKLNSQHASSLRIKAAALTQLGRNKEARQTVKYLLKLVPGFNLRRYQEAMPQLDYRTFRIVVESLKNAGVPD